MTSHSTLSSWHQANQHSLLDAIARVRQLLEQQTEPEIQPPSPRPSALDHLCQTFKLSSFERDLLVLCAGAELEAGFASLCAVVQGDSQRPYPTFNLALSALPNPAWAALAPNAPLRRWRLIEIGVGHTLTSSPLRIDEQILHYLTGNYHLSEHLTGMGTPVSATDSLVPSHAQLSEQLVSTWYVASREEELLPVLQLCGKDLTSQRAIAAVACTRLNLSPYAIATKLLPTDLSNLNVVKCLWEREYGLNRVVLLLEFEDLETFELRQRGAIAHFIEQVQVPIMLLGQTRHRQTHRPILTFEVSSPTPAEQSLLWHSALTNSVPNLNGQIDRLVSHFNFSAPAIRAACLEVKNHNYTEASDLETVQTHLWTICRVQARPRLDELAQRIESNVGWDDLVLPELEQQVLRAVAAQLRQRTKVYEDWGFGGNGKRGLGISALFAGASGTGKTLAAEVLAQELQLDLYRIDLSAVVSKYIGETEKNLGRVFDAAETSSVILLFDEADALFGKRSEVKDARDRYANMEVSYLLQRMEAYRGLAILTTNLKNAIDQAFLRRIRFIVNFPFPDATLRAQIWKRAFPYKTPAEGLDEWKLAKLNIAGGNIRNIALNAAFIAADADQPVRMEHILQAARSEYSKLERPLMDAEIKGWI